MTTEGRLIRDLPEILGDLAMGPYPEYIDDVLATSATIRQRPAWTFPERWLPMVDLVRQPVFMPRVPWRSIALAIVVLLALLAAAIVYVGSQQRVPAPFGPARNGLIAYSAGDDIYTVDPVTGTATPIITGPETDRGPRFSLDGTHIAFARLADNGTSQIYVARSDGTGLTLVTPTPVSLATGGSGRAWERYKFSPDGRELLIATASGITIAGTDGSGASQLDVGMLAEEPTYRPPDGNQILFIGRGASTGLFVLDRSTAETRQIVKMNPGFDLAGASWSPDGSKVAYWTWGNASDGLSAKTHVVNADGSGDRELPSPTGAVWNAHATWSNDGTRLFLARGFTPGEDDVRGYVAPADGGSPGIQIAPAGSVETACCAAWLWSPDDSELLGRPAALDAGEPMVILDAAGGPVRTVPWNAISDPTWQRRAP
jgi:dipeptidyl aminopeptidase/acylaminoacyl peptidase